jgi:hypothetical protein
MVSSVVIVLESSDNGLSSFLWEEDAAIDVGGDGVAAAPAATSNGASSISASRSRFFFFVKSLSNDCK